MQTYVFNNRSIKIQNSDGQVWFCGADITHVIGYKNGIQAIKKNVSSKYIREISLGGKGRKPFFVSKAGLYELIMKSELLTVKVLQRWVYQQVLPPILTIEAAVDFLLTLNTKEVSDLPEQLFKTNDIVMVDYGNHQHEAIVLDFLQNILVCIRFLDNGKNGFVVAGQLSKIKVKQ